MQKILLTGASGFLGKIIYEHLKEKFDVTTLGREKVSSNHIMYDLRTESNLKYHSSFDIIIHCAGKAHSLPKNNDERNEFYKVNQCGTKNLLNFINNLEVKPKAIVFISTVAVYGLDFGIDIDENTPLNSVDAYGNSKIEAEKIITNWCKINEVVYTILRLPLLIGKNPKGNLLEMINGIKKGYYVNIDNGKARKSMVLAEDVANFIPFVSKIGGIYNLTDGYNPSFFELSKYIAKQLGKKSPLNISNTHITFIAKIGDIFGKYSPINSAKLQKITSDLTFSDFKAKKEANWNPKPVLNNFNLF